MAVTINIPSQVKTFANLAAFPATGSLKTIFIAEDTNKTYRWTGSVYVEISGADFSGYVPTSRTLTINGTTQDLSANRTFTIPTDLTIGTTPISSGTIGRVLFQGTGNVLQQSGNLFWDDTNLRLGINGTPTSPLEIFYNPTGISNTIGLTLNSGSTGSTLKAIRFTAGTFGELGTFGVNTGSGEFRWATSSSYFPTIYSNGAERLRIATTGNVLINTTTDAGFRLDVNGTARVSGNLTTSAGIQNFSNYQGYGQMQLFSGSAFQMFNSANNSKASFQYTTATGLSLSINPENLSGILNGLVIGPSLVASANNNTLVGLDISPTFNNGAFTGVTNYGIRSYLNISGIYDGLQIRNTAAASNAQSRIKFDNDITPTQTSTGGVIFYTSSVFSGFPSNSFGLWNYNSSGVIALATNATERLRIASTGNLLINTTTDAGFRLDVNGTARVTSVTAGNGLVSTWATSGNFARFGHTGYNAPTNFGFLQESNGNSYMNGASSYIGAANNIIFDTNAVEKMRITLGGNVLIGTATAGASKLRVVGLPTSSAGLSAGDIWNDAGTLKIV
jgi:hypothetical protein